MNSGEDRAWEGIIEETKNEESPDEPVTAERSPAATSEKNRRTNISRIVVLISFGLLVVLAFLFFQHGGRAPDAADDGHSGIDQSTWWWLERKSATHSERVDEKCPINFSLSLLVAARH